MDLHNEEHVRALTESLVRASLDGSQVRVELHAGVGAGGCGVFLEDGVDKYPAFDMHLHPGPFGGPEGARLPTDVLIRHLNDLGVKSCALCGVGQRIENSHVVYYADPAVKQIVPSLCNDFRNGWFKSTMEDPLAKEKVHVCLTGFTMFHEADEPGGIGYAYNAFCAEFRGKRMLSGFGEFNVIKQAITEKDPRNMRGLHQNDPFYEAMLHLNFERLLTIQHTHSLDTKRFAPLLMHCDMGHRKEPTAYHGKIATLLKKIDTFKKENGHDDGNVLVWLHFGGICPEMANNDPCNDATAVSYTHLRAHET